jgi:tetratricopeptide (TPR) repeat protein
MKLPRLVVLVTLALAAVTLAAYWPAVHHSFVNFDDHEYVYANPAVLDGLNWEGVRWAFTTTHAANWHPLTWLSLQLDASLFGTEPFGFHLTNVLLHTVNGVLLFWFFLAATGRLWCSATVAGLFALHPLHVESVAWVAERKDVLSTLFLALTLLAYLAYVRRPGPLRYLAVAAALAVGLLAKPMLVTVPCLLLLLDYWPLQRAVRPTRLVAEKIPLFLLVGLSCALTLSAQQGAVVSVTDCGPLARVGNAQVAYVVYLRKALLPTDLAVFYPHPGNGLPVAQAVGAALLLGLLSLLFLRPYRTQPYLAVGWLWYLGTLVPVIGLVQVGVQALADRYTYIPLIGIFVMLAWGAADLAARRAVPRPALAAVGLAVLAGALVATRWQLQFWRDSEPLWQRVLAVSPPHWMPHRNLGLCLVHQGRRDEAIIQFREAARLAPELRDNHNDLAGSLYWQGQWAEAEKEYLEVLRLAPDLLEARFYLAAALGKQGRLRQARANWEEVLKRDPANSRAHLELGTVLEKLGLAPAALDCYRRALQADPRLAPAHFNLGTLLGRRGQVDQALAHLREATRLDPGYAAAHENLGHALVEQGSPEQAVDCFRQAVRLGPRNLRARLSLAEALQRLGKTAAARREYAEALALDPQWPFQYGQRAWKLATHPDPRLREGAVALALAEEACLATEHRQPQLLDVLAAAYAAAGRFGDAAKAARQALARARESNHSTLIPPLQQRLDLYTAGKPFVDPSLR